MTREEFMQAGRQAIATVKRLPIEQITITELETFALYGMDSLDTMNFLLELEESTGLSLGEVDMAACNTLDKLYLSLA